MEDNNIVKSLVDSLIKERESERKFKIIGRILIFGLFILVTISVMFSSSGVKLFKRSCSYNKY